MALSPSLRNTVLQEWRGLPQRPLRVDRWTSTADALPALLEKLGLKERLRETEVIDAWASIVGEFIAKHSAPVSLRDRVLYVRVLQPALHYELEQISKAEVVRKLKLRFGTKVVKDVKFRLG